jgi:hypothetical protein
MHFPLMFALVLFGDSTLPPVRGILTLTGN